ncbi:MAG: methyltransferase domain-containing protein, partial [Deltaproteobacteria bacterium]|nr:methyltransferase domain-containing protein [Deltaproteobacteria bacterium]
SQTINRIVVTTDDDEITAIAKKNGAEVVRRPDETATDEATSESALLHVLDHLQEESYLPDLVVFLQATSPYRLASDIDGAVDLLLEEEFDSVFTGCPEHFTGRWTLGDDLCATPLNFEPGHRPRRQDHSIEYLENGSIYIFRPQVLRETGARMGGRIGIYPMPTERSYQIDVMDDIALFDKLLMTDSIPSLPQERLTPTLPPPHLLARIELLALDFDGVLTDNRVRVDNEGCETVSCSRSDSWGITQLKKIGVKVAVISTESSPVVEARCRKLDVPCISNCRNKADALSQLAVSLEIDRTAVAFVGNDTNDTEALRWAAVPVLVGDCNSSLRSLGAWVVRHTGGRGAVREVCDAIIEAKSPPTERSIEGEGVYFVRRVPTKVPDYESNYWGTVVDPDGVERDRLKERENHLMDVATELTFLNDLPGGAILDVGCGLGYLLSGLDGRWECQGVEISEFAADHAGEWGRIFKGSLEDAKYSSGQFDAVVFHHVIEHLVDPLKTLREIRRIMKPGGWLILGTPDFDSGCARLFGSRYRLLHDDTHVSLFTDESMHRLLRDEGFVIEKVDYPYFSTRHFTKENLLRMLDLDCISPPFYGSFMTFYARKPAEGELLRSPVIELN